MPGDGSLPTVSVVIPTHDRCHRLGRALDAVLADPAVTEVVAVDDGSTDGTRDLLEARAADDPRLRAVHVDQGGQDRARQIGTEMALGEVVLLLDDDVIAAPGLAAGHARHHAAEEGLVVVGYMPVRLEGRRRRGRVAAHLYAENYEWVCRRWETDPATVLGQLWGGNVSLRRRDALRVGLVSPSGRIPYGEDRDMGLRFLAAGLRGRFDRSLLASHEHERTVDAYLREGRARAAGAMQVHAAHADVLGPLTLERYEEWLPAPGRWAVRLARHPRVAAAELAALRAVIGIAGLIRWWKLESLAALVALHVVEVRTIVEARGQRGARREATTP